MRCTIPTTLIASLLAVSALGGCATNHVSSDPIVIGAIFDLTGFQGDLDTPSAAGARLATAEANDRRGTDGRRVELIVADGQSEAEIVAQRTEELLADRPDVVALVGLSDTDMVRAAAQVSADAERIFVTSGATSPRLPGEVPEYLYLACFGDNVQAAAAAEWLRTTRDARTAALLLDQTTTYTRLLARYFADAFESRGGRVTTKAAFEPGDVEWAVGSVASPDVVYLSTSDPASSLEIVRGLRQRGYDGPIVGGDGLDLGAEWVDNRDITDVFFTTHAYLGSDSSDPRVQAFRTAYLEANDGAEPDAFAALGYDTVNLLLTAIASADGTSPSDVRDALSAIRVFDGVTGTMHFPVGARMPIKTVTIVEVRDGRPALVEELLPDDVPRP